jgi:hypothetical protein
VAHGERYNIDRTVTHQKVSPMTEILKSTVLRYRSDGTVDWKHTRRDRSILDKIVASLKNCAGLISRWVSYPEHVTVTLPDSFSWIKDHEYDKDSGYVEGDIEMPCDEPEKR